jgi:hypothetical protein
MVVIVDDTGHVLTLRSDAVVAATVMCPITSLGPACMGKVRFYARVKQPIVLFADPLL